MTEIGHNTYNQKGGGFSSFGYNDRNPDGYEVNRNTSNPGSYDAQRSPNFDPYVNLPPGDNPPQSQNYRPDAYHYPPATVEPHIDGRYSRSHLESPVPSYLQAQGPRRGISPMPPTPSDEGGGYRDFGEQPRSTLSRSDKFGTAPIFLQGTDGPQAYRASPMAASPVSPGYQPERQGTPQQGYYPHGNNAGMHTPQSATGSYRQEPHTVHTYQTVGPPQRSPNGPGSMPRDQHHVDYSDIATVPIRSPHVLGSSTLPSQNNQDPQSQLDLKTVVGLLSEHDESTALNAAHYLQHITFKNDIMKERVKTFGGIRPLLQLLRSTNPNVRRSALRVLRNMAYTKNVAIHCDITRPGGAGSPPDGAKTLVTVLQEHLLQHNQSPANDEMLELITAVLWNLSTCPEVKRPIIDSGVSVLVNMILIPSAGLEKNGDRYILPNVGNKQPNQIYWNSLLKNATGIIRNVSSNDRASRNILRDTDGLIECLLAIVEAASNSSDIDNRSVENCVCTLRNLSYALQEIVDPDYLQRRMDLEHGLGTHRGKPITKTTRTTTSQNLLFGKKKKTKTTYSGGQPNGVNTISSTGSQENTDHLVQAPTYGGRQPMGIQLLWQPDIVNTYIAFLPSCSNPETLEAAVGAVQNLTACEWAPSQDIRVEFRKQKGLTYLVDLLLLESDPVVRTTATALRNLSMDKRNYELIGKYATANLACLLPNGPQQIAANGQPQPRRNPSGIVPGLSEYSNETLASVLATLYCIICNSNGEEYAKIFHANGGVQSCMYIISSGQYIEKLSTGLTEHNRSKVPRFANELLWVMWGYNSLHPDYTRSGWEEADFCPMGKTQGNKKNPDLWCGGKRSGRGSITRPGMNKSGVASDRGSVSSRRMIKRQPKQENPLNHELTIPSDKPVAPQWSSRPPEFLSEEDRRYSIPQQRHTPISTPAYGTLASNHQYATDDDRQRLQHDVRDSSYYPGYDNPGLSSSEVNINGYRGSTQGSRSNSPHHLMMPNGGAGPGSYASGRPASVHTGSRPQSHMGTLKSNGQDNMAYSNHGERGPRSSDGTPARGYGQDQYPEPLYAMVDREKKHLQRESEGFNIAQGQSSDSWV